jgi:hypothetical protein
MVTLQCRTVSSRIFALLILKASQAHQFKMLPDNVILAIDP